MIQETTWRSIWSMNWTNEAPSLRQEFSNCRCLHFCEVLASMHTSEMGKISREIQLICDNCESGCLLHVKLRSCD